MATNTWDVDSSGSWGDAGNWSSGAAPLSTDDVVIDYAGITVSVGAGVAAVAHTLDVVNSTLSISGGTLYTVENAEFDGTFVETAGTYTMSGYGATFRGAMDFAGGAIDVLSGAVSIYNGSILAGTFAGTGALDLIGGNSYIDKGFACTLSSIMIGAQGGKLGFNIDFSYANNFTVLQAGVVDLFGHTLTLTGNSLLDGTIGYGKIAESGNMTLGAGATFDNGLTLSVGGVVKQIGNIALGTGDSGAKLAISKSGQYDIAGNYIMADPSSIGTITNSGIFAKTFGGKTATVFADFKSTGTVNVRIGTLLLDGLVNSVSGTVSGGGTLGIAGGQTTFGNKLLLQSTALEQQSGILVLNKALSYAGIWDMTGGVLDLNSTAATLALSSQADFDGGTLSGYGGTVAIEGTAHVGNVTFGGPNTIAITGTLDQTNSIAFGVSSNTTATIAAGAAWNLEGDSAIIGSYGLIENAGMFADLNGSGNAVVQTQMISTGTIEVNNSTLTLAGINTLSGTLSGTGLLTLEGPTTLAGGTALTVASLAIDGTNPAAAGTALGGNLAYANSFAIENGGALYLDGHKLSLSGLASLDTGSMSAGGTVVSAGPTFIGNFAIGGTTDLTVTGSAEQTGNLDLAPQFGPGTLTVAAGATYTLDDDVSISANTIPGSLVIGGTFTAAGTGQSQIAAIVTDSGLLQVNDQLLTLGYGGVIAGRIAGTGTVDFSYFGSGGTYTLSTGTTLAMAGWQVASGAIVQVQANVAYAGLFQQFGGGGISLGGDTLTLSGTSTIAGAVTGPGTLLASGSDTLSNLSILQGSTLTVSGTSEQLSTIQLGDGPSLQTPPSTAKLLISSTGQYTLDANANILGNGTLSVAGHLTQNGDGLSTIGATIVDTGTIAANLGTLNILGTVSGTGAFSIGGAGFLAFANTATITASNTISFTAGGGNLLLNDIASFGAVLAGFAQNDVIELGGFNTGTVGDSWNGADTQLTVSDSSGTSLTLVFSTAQTPSSITLGTLASGLVTLTHS